MGAVFRGKAAGAAASARSCPSSVCELGSAHDRTPHRHCQPCLGCTRNCFDLSPRNALLADLHDSCPTSRASARFRRLFLGFILGFFLMRSAATLAVWQVYAILALASLVSLGSFFLLESIFRVSAHKLIVLYGAAALCVLLVQRAGVGKGLVAAPPPAWLVALLRASVLALAGNSGLARTFRKETEYVAQVQARPAACTSRPPTCSQVPPLWPSPATAGQAVKYPSVPILVPSSLKGRGTRIAVSGNRTSRSSNSRGLRSRPAAGWGFVAQIRSVS
ncbi:MAG: hypothetical protein U0X20_31605 [Caldilineaceae bacterium]